MVATESLLEYLECCRITVCWMQDYTILDGSLGFSAAVLDQVTQFYTIVPDTCCYIGGEVRDEA